MDKPQAINKIKLLLKLAESSNQNEAGSARLQAEKLKQKFDVKDQDLSDGPDIFEERFLLFSMKEDLEYKRALAFTISNKFYCALIQEITVLGPTECLYQFFLYGDDSDIASTKTYFIDICAKVDKLIEDVCKDQTNLYRCSFGIGVVDVLKQKLETIDFYLPKARKIKDIAKDNAIVQKTEAIAKEIKKPEQVKNVSGVLTGKTEFDPVGYLRGYTAGQHIPFVMSLEQENETEEIGSDD